VLLVASAFNGLTQRTKVELECQGHKVSVQLFTSPTDVESAVEASQPDLIICPFLKDRLPPSVYEDHICLIVHPGVMGDKGPSSLDWALTEGKTMWGVTVLQVSCGHELHMLCIVPDPWEGATGQTLLQPSAVAVLLILSTLPLPSLTL
jgi:hypothetical protein